MDGVDSPGSNDNGVVDDIRNKLDETSLTDR